MVIPLLAIALLSTARTRVLPNSEHGKIVFGKRFTTKYPTSFGYKGNGKFYLCDWKKDTAHLTDGTVGEWRIKVPAGLEFEIKEMYRGKTFSGSNYMFFLHFRILSNPKLRLGKDQPIQEFLGEGPIGSKNGKWYETTVQTTQNPIFKNLISDDFILNITGTRGEMQKHPFFGIPWSSSLHVNPFLLSSTPL